MQYAHRYTQYAITALNGYDGSLPLHHYLKQFFAADKKYGSKDRKHISQLCYCYFRLGHALKELPAAERLYAAAFLCSQPPLWETLFSDEWKQHYAFDRAERIGFLQHHYLGFQLQQIFPWLSQCSKELQHDAFLNSFLVQPDVFLRIRPGRHQKVLSKLNENNITYSLPYPDTVALAPSVKADQLLQLNRDVVVQDASSQKVGAILKMIPPSSKPVMVWDCCAASGGKSILAADTLKNINLTVSDVRASIIHNLKQRFQEAGIQQYKSFVADLSVPQPAAVNPKFNLVICDAPCTGSGTWSRTPEQLYYFKEEEIGRYASLQRKIMDNASVQVLPGGYFLYITCSVFQQENENQVSHLLQQPQWELVTQQLITGYHEKADTMFAALLKRKLG